MTQSQQPFTQASQSTVGGSQAAAARGRRKLLPVDEDSDGETIGPPASGNLRGAKASRSQATQTQRAGNSRGPSEEPPATSTAKRKRKAAAAPAAPKVTGPVDMSLGSDSDDAAPPIPAKRTRRAASSSIGDTEEAEEILPSRSTRSSGTRTGTGRRKLLPVDEEDAQEVSLPYPQSPIP
jgi:hypothetical protein